MQGSAPVPTTRWPAAIAGAAEPAPPSGMRATILPLPGVECPQGAVGAHDVEALAAHRGSGGDDHRIVGQRDAGEEAEPPLPFGTPVSIGAEPPPPDLGAIREPQRRDLALGGCRIDDPEEIAAVAGTPPGNLALQR